MRPIHSDAFESVVFRNKNNTTASAGRVNQQRPKQENVYMHHQPGVAVLTCAIFAAFLFDIRRMHDFFERIMNVF